MTETPAPYSMSFTSGALLKREAVLVAGLFGEHGHWDATRAAVLSANRLQLRTINARKRIWQEVSSRLKQLTPDQLALLLNGACSDRQHILWLAVCKRYRFIYDFAAEVIHEQFLRGDLRLTHADYDQFFSRKAVWHPEVDRVAPATRAKLRQVLFKMLREADLVAGMQSGVCQLRPALLSRSLIRAIGSDDPAHFVIYPVSSLLLQDRFP